MFACLGKTEEEQKENWEHANAEKDMIVEYEKWTYLITGYQRPWILKLVEVLACG